MYDRLPLQLILFILLVTVMSICLQHLLYKSKFMVFRASLKLVLSGKLLITVKAKYTKKKRF